MANPTINKYYDKSLTSQAIEREQHRAWVGGMWESIGKLQFEFLLQQGLRPNQKVLDLGCGCFRAGVHLVQHLDIGHYFGVDISQELLDAGYERELVPNGLDARLPKENLACSEDFEVDAFNVNFDYVIAQSVFTHLSFNHLRQCLSRIWPSVAVGGVFYATAFICPSDQPLTEPLKHQPGGIVTYPVQDPFHYAESDFEYAARGLPWRVELIGAWDHPRNQSMIAFHRIAE
ncbi:MAG: SAM-dependent methyltransferase [Oceanococcus sp.]